MIEVEILKMKPCHIVGEKSDAIASFDALAGGFRIRNSHIRRSHVDGRIWASVRTGSANTTGVGICLPHGPVRDAIEARALEAYSERAAS